MTPQATDVLEMAAARARTLAASWAAALQPDDHAIMAASFYRAESLAHIALEAAREQLEDGYRAELTEQMADEERHVALFAEWLGPDRETITAPKLRQRGPAVWFGLLLVNEVCGFCQFNMLAGLLADPERRDAVDAVAADEIVHILRLLRWIAPLRGQPSYAEIQKVTGRFRRNLGHRMAQFLPSEALAPLRRDMSEIVSALLVDLTGATPQDSAVFK